MKIGMRQNNIKIAITGGICSGKSTVAKFIEEQGYPVISCDKIYADLLSDTNFVDILAAKFGDIKNSDGTLNKKKLADIVFNDASKLKELNEITHPKIMQKAIEQMSGEGIFFCEVPLLFEGGFEKLFDGIVVVLRKKEDRVKELTLRSKIDEKQALLRINSQFDYENNDFIKYYVIHNDANLQILREKVYTILNEITQKL